MEEKQAEAYNQHHEEAPPPYDHYQVPEEQPMCPTEPSKSAGYPPQGQPGYPPQGQPGYPPQGQSGHPAQPGYPQVYAPGVAPGYPVTQQPYGAAPAVVFMNPSPGLQNPPPTHLGLAIFVTLCCCWPLGIVAIIRSSSTKNAISRGDRAEAVRNSKQAKKFSMWSIGLGIFANIIGIALVVVYILYVLPTLKLHP